MRNSVEVCLEFEDEPVRDRAKLWCRRDTIVCHMNSLLSPEKCDGAFASSQAQLTLEQRNKQVW